MTVDILITQAADVIHLRDRSAAVVILTTVPRVLVDCIVDKTVRDVGVDAACFLITDRIRHAAACRAAGGTVVRVATCTALLLAVTTTILRVEQVRDARVHQSIDLLHTPLDTVIVEICPRKARSRAAARDAGTELRAHDRTANNSAKVLVVGNPVGFHVLDLVAVRQHHLVELRRVQNREVKGRGVCRNLGDQVHTRLETVAQGRDHDRADDSAGVIREDAANQVRARNAREAYFLVAGHAYLAHRVRAVRTVALRERFLPAHDLTAGKVATAGTLDVVKRDNGGLGRGGHVVRVIIAVAGVVLPVQVIVHALAPEEGLVHHPVALAAVKRGRRAVGVPVAVRIVQRVVGHLAVQIVHSRIHAGHGHAARSGLLRHFGKHPVPLRQDRRDMAACLIGGSVLVARTVVKVAHVRVVRHLVVELDHRVFRLPDVQLREVGGIGGVGILVQVTGQANRTHQRAGVRGVAVRVHAAHFHELLQPRAVILAVDTRHPYAVNVGTT